MTEAQVIFLSKKLKLSLNEDDNKIGNIFQNKLYEYFLEHNPNKDRGGKSLLADYTILRKVKLTFSLSFWDFFFFNINLIFLNVIFRFGRIQKS